MIKSYSSTFSFRILILLILGTVCLYAMADSVGAPLAEDARPDAAVTEDFNCDGVQDFAVISAGGVKFFLSDPATGKRSQVGMRFFSDETGDGVESSPVVAHGALAAGDFDADGCGDLAAGAPDARGGEGAAYVIYGAVEMTEDSVRRETVFMESPQIPGVGSDEHRLGDELVATDFDRDGFSDLIVSLPGYEGGPAVLLLYGGVQGLVGSARHVVHQLTSLNGPGLVRVKDLVAMRTTVGDFDGDGGDDLVAMLLSSIFGHHGAAQGGADGGAHPGAPYVLHVASHDGVEAGDFKTMLRINGVPVDAWASVPTSGWTFETGSYPTGDGFEAASAADWYVDGRVSGGTVDAWDMAAAAGRALWNGLTVGDFDGDGTSDLAVRVQRRVSLDNAATLDFTIDVSAPRVGFVVDAAAGVADTLATDFNGDGLTDLVVRSGGYTDLIKNAGDGHPCTIGVGAHFDCDFGNATAKNFIDGTAPDVTTIAGGAHVDDANNINMGTRHIAGNVGSSGNSCNGGCTNAGDFSSIPPESGWVYLSNDGTGTFDLGRGWMFTAGVVQRLVGTAIGTGDLNADGLADLIVAGRQAAGADGAIKQPGYHIVYGNADGVITAESLTIPDTHHPGPSERPASHLPAIPLVDKVPIIGLTDEAQGEQRFIIEVPEGTAGLGLTLAAVEEWTGDADLYVSCGSPPTLTDYDCRSRGFGSSESCRLKAPPVGTCHVLVHAATAYRDVKLNVDLEP